MSKPVNEPIVFQLTNVTDSIFAFIIKPIACEKYSIPFNFELLKSENEEFRLT